MSGDSKKLNAMNYFGGKFSFIDEIYFHFPMGFTHLVDLFAGSFVVSINYRGRCIKTANEINSEVTNFFQVLRDDTEKLLSLIEMTPCSVKEFENAWKPTDNKLESARRFYVRVRMSYLGLGCQRKNKGMFLAKEQVNAAYGETVSKWNNSFETLKEVAKLISTQFQITNFDYLECMSKFDTKNTFFYCDPPYPKESRSSFNDYHFEFTDGQHRQLSEKLHSINGYAMISSYECDLMDELYSDWRMVRLSQKKNNMRKEEVQECIWMNYDAPQDLFSNI